MIGFEEIKMHDGVRKREIEKGEQRNTTRGIEEWRNRDRGIVKQSERGIVKQSDREIEKKRQRKR